MGMDMDMEMKIKIIIKRQNKPAVGDEAVLEAGTAVVSKNIKPFGIYCGIPAKKWDKRS